MARFYLPVISPLGLGVFMGVRVFYKYAKFSIGSFALSLCIFTFFVNVFNI